MLGSLEMMTKHLGWGSCVTSSSSCDTSTLNTLANFHPYFIVFNFNCMLPDNINSTQLHLFPITTMNTNMQAI